MCISGKDKSLFMNWRRIRIEGNRPTRYSAFLALLLMIHDAKKENMNAEIVTGLPVISAYQIAACSRRKRIDTVECGKEVVGDSGFRQEFTEQCFSRPVRVFYRLQEDAGRFGQWDNQSRKRITFRIQVFRLRNYLPYALGASVLVA